MDGAGEIRVGRTGFFAFGEDCASENTCSLFSNSEGVEHVSVGVDVVSGTGHRHIAVACTSGRVYTFGYNEFHDWMTKEKANQPTLVAALSSVKIVQVACGSRSTFFLTDVGDLYSCGENSYGQLGLGISSSSTTPVMVKGIPQLKKVVAGLVHSVALTQSGDVYVCGQNEYGQLGLEGRENKSNFTLISGLPEKVTDIACGSYHTVLLTESKGLLISGRNNYCQLGYRGEDSSKFQSITLEGEVISVACGSNHTVAHTSSNLAWAWGANECCQLGNGQHGESDLVSQVLGLEGHTIVGVFAGHSHTGFLSDKGDVLVCGRGQSEELLPKKTTVTVPTLLSKSPGLRVKQVEFGDTFTLLVVTTLVSDVALQKDRANYRIDEQTKNLVNDLRKVIVKCLECPVCLNPMSKPIHMCTNGHSVCGPCYSNLNPLECPLCRHQFSGVKNMALQSLATEIQLPCAECALRMPVTEVETHSIVCPNRHYICPLGNTCGFRGRPESLLAHALSNHPLQTLQELPHTFTHCLSDLNVLKELMVMDNQVFILHRTSTAEEVRFEVGIIGQPDDADKFKFKLEFNADSDDYSVTIRNVGSYVEKDEKLFKSQNCASIKKDQFASYLKHDNVTCKMHIINASK